MGQTIKKIKRWFWRKKQTTKGVPIAGEEYNASKEKWKDIAIRTAKTFLQVALGVIVTAIANPPDAWKPVLITAVTSGTCAAMNYIIKVLESGDDNAP